MVHKKYNKEKSNKKETVSALNRILKEEYTASDLYDDSIKQAESETLKELLTIFHDQHKEQITAISTRIQNLGAAPKKRTGIAGIMSNTMMEMGRIFGMKPSDRELIENIYTQMQNGINTVERAMKENLDSESKKIVADTLATGHKQLKEFKRLLN